MTMFCNVAHPLVPGIASLDNFYAKQHETGRSCREINRATGMDNGPWVNREGRPLFSRNGWVPPQDPEAPVIYRGRMLPACSASHPRSAGPILSPRGRAGEPPGHRRPGADRPGLRSAGTLFRRCRNTCGRQRPLRNRWASMDNSPRNVYRQWGHRCGHLLPDGALCPRTVGDGGVVGKAAEARAFAAEADELSRTINELMWDRRGVLFDLTARRQRAPVKDRGGILGAAGRVASASRRRIYWPNCAIPRPSAARTACRPWRPTNRLRSGRGLLPRCCLDAHHE